MIEAKRVVVYGLVNSASDHRDYAVLGEWTFDLYERTIFPTIRPPAFRIQWSDARGRFISGPPKKDKRGLWHDAKGRFISGEPRERHVPVPYREVPTGRYANAPLTGPKPSGGIPDDDTIVADTLQIIEDKTGHRLYRTPGMRETGQDRVSIGIQHLEDTAIGRTYTYAEYLRELRHRAHNEWSNR